MAIKVGTWGWRDGALRVAAAVAMLAPLPSLAQEAAPSESAMVNLVRALVAQGALKADVGADLIRQAEAEAQQARAANLAASQTPRDLPPAAAGSIRVPYVPESVRAQIKDELRQEVLADARSGGWAAPDKAAPDWTRRIALSGDIRVRSESEFYSKTNSNEVIDYATINALSPYGIDDPRLLLPILNTRNNQWNSPRLRARIGVDIAVAPEVTAGFMLATGDNQGPISTNDVLAGGFLKRDIWVDKAWLKLAPRPWFSGTFGRFVVPFKSSDLLYDQDLSLDGMAIELNSDKWLGENLKVTLRGGAFPFDLGNPNAPTFAFDKPRASQKYLFAGEAELSGKIEDISFSVAAGLHDFDNFQGDLSEPCLVETDSFCSTDHLQPIFLTKGNTLSPLRQIVTVDPDAALPQLLGYTFKYRVLDINAMVSVPIAERVEARVMGSFVKNLAFRESDICRNGLAGRPYNNNAAGGGTFCAADPAQRASFAGGDTGYRVEAVLGRMQPFEQGEFHLSAGYRYLESDAVLDGLTDSDFHLGGTNAKGYFLGGAYALRKGLTIGGRWLSANEIEGPPLAIDVLQVDLEVRF